MATTQKPPAESTAAADTTDSKPAQANSFTARSIGFGLLGVLFICTLSFFNDDQLGQTLFLGNLFPVGVVLYLLLVVLAWNPLIGLVIPSWVLRPRELVVVLALTLTAAFLPTHGFNTLFARQIILPVVNSPGLPMWQKYQVLDSLPPRLFPLERNVQSPQFEQVYTGFKQGLRHGSQNIGFLEWPVGAWVKPIAVGWGPLLVLFMVMLTAMALVVHRQWSVHEQLSYPLAAIFTSLIQRTEQAGGARRFLPDLFRERFFWWGFLPVALFYFVMLLSKWFPGTVPEYSFATNLTPVFVDTFGETFRAFLQPGSIANFNFHFVAFGIAYLLPAEIALSVGVAPWVWGLVCLLLFTSSGYVVGGNDSTSVQAGAFLAFAIVLLYTGRTYYGTILRKAFGFGRPTDDERDGVWAARILVASTLGFWLLLSSLGLDWFIASSFVLCLLLFFLVCSRIVCEAGLFLFGAWWPKTLLLALLGGAAIGPGAFMVVSWLGTLFVYDLRQALIPHVANSLRIAELVGVESKRKLTGAILAGLGVAAVVSFLVAGWVQYNYGGANGYGGTYVPYLAGNSAVEVATQLESTGMLARAQSTHGLAKLALIRPDSTLMKFFAFGFLMLLLFSFLRVRFKWWPLHPVIFLVVGTWGVSNLYWSSLVGWAVKSMVQRFGGGLVYQRLRPLFLGMVVAHVAIIALGIVIGYVYFFVTGTTPVNANLFL